MGREEAAKKVGEAKIVEMTAVLNAAMPKLAASRKIVEQTAASSC